MRPLQRGGRHSYTRIVFDSARTGGERFGARRVGAEAVALHLIEDDAGYEAFGFSGLFGDARFRALSRIL